MNDIYTTKDFYLSSYLIASGVNLQRSFKDAGYTIFEFDETKQLQSLVKSYYGFSATVNPVTYSNAIRSLKTIIYSNSNDKQQFTHNSGRTN